MANLLQKLRKENNESDKLLSKENQKLMTDMVVYLRCSNLCNYDIEVIRRELFGMTYEAQLRGEDAGQVLGDDYKSLCEELMRNGRQKDFYEKFLEWAYIIVVGMGVLFAIELVSSGFIFDAFPNGRFSMPIPLGFLITVCMIILGSVAVYRYFTKHSFEMAGKRQMYYSLIFIAGFTLYFACSVMVRLLLDDVVLFRINVFIPAAALTASYLIVKHLENRNSDAVAKTHN